ncbi:MAG: DUF3768 domain-containing protein, partial [Caldilineaceae bacterium]|nr:DUF3768 domain-containing protein [Caldilineaceae bacterium]
MMQIIFECDGSDLLALACPGERTEADLLSIARQLAAAKDAFLSDLSFRFAEGHDVSALSPSIGALPGRPDDAQVTLLFEEGGSDRRSYAHAPQRFETDLLTMARSLAVSRDSELNHVTLRFVDPFETLLAHYPAEELVEPDDPDYDMVQHDGGCRSCASGSPCRERLRHDVADILLEAGLPDDARTLCLEWMTQEACSSLTRSIHQMAEGFQAYLQAQKATIIAAQNDAFRHRIGTGEPALYDGAPIPGMAVVTPGIQAMSLLDQARILAQVREFRRWTPDNDPYGEHDFG